MKIILAAVEESLANAWERFCGDVDGVSVHRGSILDVDCDAVVSPANSFGFMDGGIDALYLDYFGPAIQVRVRRQIYDRHHGELVVGTAEIVETGDARPLSHRGADDESAHGAARVGERLSCRPRHAPTGPPWPFPLGGRSRSTHRGASGDSCLPRSWNRGRTYRREYLRATDACRDRRYRTRSVRDAAVMGGGEREAPVTLHRSTATLAILTWPYVLFLPESWLTPLSGRR